jgi:hypothetical protein
LVDFAGGGSGSVDGDDAVAPGDDEEVDEERCFTARSKALSATSKASWVDGKWRTEVLPRTVTFGRQRRARCAASSDQGRH